MHRKIPHKLYYCRWPGAPDVFLKHCTFLIVDGSFIEKVVDGSNLARYWSLTQWPAT
jgi:hypothetical protein